MGFGLLERAISEPTNNGLALLIHDSPSAFVGLSESTEKSASRTQPMPDALWIILRTSMWQPRTCTDVVESAPWPSARDGCPPRRASCRPQGPRRLTVFTKSNW